MTFEIVVNGRVRKLDWPGSRDGTGHLRMVLDGEPVAADVAAVEPGVYSVLLDGSSYDVRVVPAAEGYHVEAGDSRYEITVRDPRRFARRGAAGGAAGRRKVASPMPGKVVRVLVGAGDEVTAGQGLAVVEAMKMQNEIRSPQAGRVVAVAAVEGATVAAGEALVEVE